MNRPYRPRRRAHRRHYGSLVAFLVVASFGILFAGCGRTPSIQGPGDAPVDDLTFTEQDLERFRRLAQPEEGTGTGDTVTSQAQSAAETPLPILAEGTGSLEQPPAIDLSMAPTYEALRASGGEEKGNLFRVTNSFLNVRSEPRISSSLVARLNGGDTVTVLEFLDAAWAKVKLSEDKVGYAAIRYLGKVTTDDKLPTEQKAFENIYFVTFAFVNVRAQPDQKSEKLGEINRDAFVRPLRVEGPWARVSYQGKEGFVSMDYIAPFRPTFLVRQEKFSLPILRYRAEEPGALEALASHLPRLRQAGMKFLRLRDVQALILRQESDRTVRLPDNAVVMTVSGLDRTNAKRASDILYGEGVPATFFLQTENVGMAGITQKTLLTLLANGFDLQSASHGGEDLRSLTNAQVRLDLARSRKILEDITGKSVFALEYPQGGVNDRVATVAAETGFLFGITSAPEKEFYRSQFLRMPSFTVTGSMSPEDVLSLVQ